MSAELSSRDRRALMLAATMLVPALGTVFVVRPFFRALAERRAAVVRERTLLTQDLAVVEGAPHHAASAAAYRAALVKEMPHVIQSAARATASVELASYVRDVARAHEVLVANTVEMPADSLSPDVHALHLAVNAESDLAGILHFLRTLEGGLIRVRVTRLHIEATNAHPTPGGRPMPEVLRMTMGLEASAILTPLSTVAAR